MIQSVVVYAFYIETKGHSLETIAVCFDGEDAKIGGQAATEKGREMLEDTKSKEPSKEKTVGVHAEQVNSID